MRCSRVLAIVAITVAGAFAQDAAPAGSITVSVWVRGPAESFFTDYRPTFPLSGSIESPSDDESVRTLPESAGSTVCISIGPEGGGDPLMRTCAPVAGQLPLVAGMDGPKPAPIGTWVVSVALFDGAGAQVARNSSLVKVVVRGGREALPPRLLRCLRCLTQCSPFIRPGGRGHGAHSYHLCVCRRTASPPSLSLTAALTPPCPGSPYPLRDVLARAQSGDNNVTAEELCQALSVWEHGASLAQEAESHPYPSLAALSASLNAAPAMATGWIYLAEKLLEENRCVRRASRVRPWLTRARLCSAAEAVAAFQEGILASGWWSARAEEKGISTAHVGAMLNRAAQGLVRASFHPSAAAAAVWSENATAGGALAANASAWFRDSCGKTVILPPVFRTAGSVQEAGLDEHVPDPLFGNVMSVPRSLAAEEGRVRASSEYSVGPGSVALHGAVRRALEAGNSSLDEGDGALHGRLAAPASELASRLPDSARPGPENITLVSLCDYDGLRTPMASLSHSNKLAYARAHGYRLMVDSRARMEGHPAAWSKLASMRRSVGLTEWIVWTDCDTFAMEPAAKLEDVIGAALADSAAPETVAGVFSNDGLMLNTGFFALRSGPFASSLLDEAMAMAPYLSNHTLWDQAALHWLLFRAPGAAERQEAVRFVPQSYVNAYPLPLAMLLAGEDGVPLHAVFDPSLRDPFVAFSGCNKLLGEALCHQLVLGYFQLAEARFAQHRVQMTQAAAA